MPKGDYKMKGRAAKSELNDSTMAAAEKALGKASGQKSAPKPKPADAGKEDPADNVRKDKTGKMSEGLARKYGDRYRTKKDS